MLVDIAEFFETSVDAMLNYGWQKLSMGQAVEKLSQFATDKRLTEGMEFAEKVLQRYPNSFDVVFRCFLWQGARATRRRPEKFWEIPLGF